MNIFKDLPYDMQCIIVKNLDTIERRRLSWNSPLTLLQKLTCTHEYTGEHTFSIRATIFCDKNGFIWLNTCVCKTSWINCVYHLKNVPLCSALTHSPKQIAMIFKRVFFEYVGYVYYYGKNTFKNRISSHFEMRKTNFEDINVDYEEDIQEDTIMNMGPRLKIKDIEKCIRQEWFSSHLDKETFCVAKPGPLIPPFYIQDGVVCIDMEDHHMPFSYEILSILQTICPHIYKCLEEFGELKCPYLPMSNPIRQYIYWYKIVEKHMNLDIINLEARDASHELTKLIIWSFNFLGVGHHDRTPTINDVFAYCNTHYLK